MLSSAVEETRPDPACLYLAPHEPKSILYITIMTIIIYYGHCYHTTVTVAVNVIVFIVVAVVVGIVLLVVLCYWF